MSFCEHGYKYKDGCGACAKRKFALEHSKLPSDIIELMRLKHSHHRKIHKTEKELIAERDQLIKGLEVGKAKLKKARLEFFTEHRTIGLKILGYMIRSQKGKIKKLFSSPASHDSCARLLIGSEILNYLEECKRDVK